MAYSDPRQGIDPDIERLAEYLSREANDHYRIQVSLSDGTEHVVLL